MSGSIVFHDGEKYYLETLNNEGEKRHSHKSDCNLSVIIPSGRGFEFAQNVILKIQEKHLINDIIIVLDGFEEKDYENNKVRKLEIDTKIIHIPQKIGASAARNVGAYEASGKILLFLDDDIIPSKTLLSGHINEYISNDNVVATVGPVNMISCDGHVNILTNNPLLYSFSSPKYESFLLWGVAANLSVRKEIFEKIKFDNEFPGNGGGEDVYVGFNLCSYGQIKPARDAVVEHYYWLGVKNQIARFYRWGRADAILTRKVNNKKDMFFKSLIRPKELFSFTNVVFITILLVVIGFRQQKPLIYSMLPLFVYYLRLYYRCRKKQNFIQALAAIFYLTCYDIGTTIERMRYKNWGVINKRVIFFQRQDTWLFRDNNLDFYYILAITSIIVAIYCIL